MTKKEIFFFHQYIQRWFKQYGRHNLPWRLTADPYAILVSELMLQQTQVSRVIPKYEQFLDRIPTLKALRNTSLADVLRLWQGLGYNRRAKYLWQLGQQVAKLPTTQPQLEQLPGIGPYTAAAICAFAYNQPVSLIETNVRTVLLYHFFPKHDQIDDAKLLPLVAETLDQKNPQAWYWALMDYGSHLKSVLPNPNRRSRHYTKQSPFLGSVRQVRGDILRQLTKNEQVTKKTLQNNLVGNVDYFNAVLADLATEGFIEKQGDYYRLRSAKR